MAKNFKSYLKVTELLFYHLLDIAFICSIKDRYKVNRFTSSISSGFLTLFSERVNFLLGSHNSTLASLKLLHMKGTNTVCQEVLKMMGFWGTTTSHFNLFRGKTLIL